MTIIFPFCYYQWFASVGVFSRCVNHVGCRMSERASVDNDTGPVQPWTITSLSFSFYQLCSEHRPFLMWLPFFPFHCYPFVLISSFWSSPFFFLCGINYHPFCVLSPSPIPNDDEGSPFLITTLLGTGLL